jgi:hypothetical protein
MQTTPNNNIKIVRLQSGEDIIADIISDDENETMMLENPMHIIFRRVPTGQTVMMLMPWLPIEIIKENNAILYQGDILTVIEPREDLINYYGNVVVEAQQRMENSKRFNHLDEEEFEGEEDDESEEFDAEELFEMLNEKKKHNLH